MEWIPCVSKALLYCLKSKSAMPSSNYSVEENDIPEIIFGLPYAEKIVEQLFKALLKHCLKKIKDCLF